MLHYLTIGFLDEDAVRVRETVAIKPLSEPILTLLEQFRDQRSDVPMLGGVEVQVTNGWVRCAWYAPQRIPAAEEFAVEAAKLGCTVADVEHGRLVHVLSLGEP